VSGESTEPRTDFHGEGNLRVFDVGAMAEGGFAGDRGTLLLGGRYSYTALLLSLIAKDTKLDYRDYQARITYDLTPKDRLTLFAFGAYDLVGEIENNTTKILFGSEFYRVDLRHDHFFDNGGTLRSALTLGYDQTHVAELRNMQDHMLAARMELNQPLSSRVKFHAGVDGVLDAYSTRKADYNDPDDPDVEDFNDLFPPRKDLAFGSYAELLLRIDDNIELTPGLRLDYFTSNGASAVAIDPRISARVRVTDKFHLVHAYGLAHQPPSFVVPVPGLSVAKLESGLQRSIQTSAGVELELPYELKLTANVFNNAFFNMTDALGTQPTIGDDEDDDESDFIGARSKGRAYGLELFLRRNLAARLGGFISYTLSRSTRQVGNQEFPAAFDRTHVGSLALAYDLGRNWRAGTRLAFYSGAPVQARDDEGFPGEIPERTKRSGRDPWFYRIDLRLEKRWNVGKRSWLSFVAEMLNATLRKEIYDGEEIGPISIPSIGLEGGF
jgi:hypothetical protein